MNYISKKHLARRTFLRGMGVTLALPLLDSMIPAQTPLHKTAANVKSRMGAIYVPHGAYMSRFTPTTEGTGFEFPFIVQPLEKYRDSVNILSNLCHMQASGKGSDAGADHARSAAVYLSGSHPEKGSIHVGVTMDQLAAQHIGQDTALPSLELAIEDVGLNCGSGYGCAYINTISWRTPTLPQPMENSPQVVFEKLFGDGSNAELRMNRKTEDTSILDSITQGMGKLQAGLGSADRARLSEYLDDIREIERRIQKATKQGESNVTVPEAPVGVPETFDEHLKLLFDLQALAFQADITRVFTLMFAHDSSGSSYPVSGNRDGFHGASHHSNITSRMESFSLINKYHAQMFAYFLEKLRNSKEGDGNILDHSMILYGSSMSNANQHDHDPLPIVVAGGGSGTLKGGRHIKMPEHTPMSNLMLTMLDKLGVHQDSFGDSTGKLDI